MTDGTAAGHRQRLRERFEKATLEGFHDHEVLELLLTYAIPRRDVKPLAKDLLTEFGRLSAVVDAPLETLKAFPGIGPNAATLLSLIPQFLDRYQNDRWRQDTIIDSTKAAVSFLSARIGAERNEVFCLLALNSRNALIAAENIQKGTVNRTAVFPRLVVEAGVKHRATAVILAHNHPSGDPQPSTADRHITTKLKKLLTELDIQVHDHIIIAGPNYFSFAENGGLA